LGRENVYLGTRVEDRGKEGLDTISEVADIAEAIIEDCVSGRISYRTAMSRMNLLELIVTRDKDFYGEKEIRARRIIDVKREELRERCAD
jgi:hypothetical protein